MQYNNFCNNSGHSNYNKNSGSCAGSRRGAAFASFSRRAGAVGSAQPSWAGSWPHGSSKDMPLAERPNNWLENGGGGVGPVGGGGSTPPLLLPVHARNLPCTPPTTKVGWQRLSCARTCRCALCVRVRLRPRARRARGFGCACECAVLAPQQRVRAR